MGLAGARKMGGSATREPELIYVVRGGGATYDNNSWRQRPTVLLPVTSERLLPSAFSGNPSHRFTCWLRYMDQKLRAIMNNLKNEGDFFDFGSSET